MSVSIPIILAFEDALTEALILRVLPVEYATKTIYRSGGYGYLKKSVSGFNNAAKGVPFLVGTDLDKYECPLALINDWLAQPKHHNLLIRVAVREAEAWTLADRDSFASFLGINVERVPADVESLPNPKETLIQLARESRKRQLREDICPRPKSTSKIGPNYNPRLCSFVAESWNPAVARLNSPSLHRTMNRLSDFRPRWVVPA
jgi:hypothetical protein